MSLTAPALAMASDYFPDGQWVALFPTAKVAGLFCGSSGGGPAQKSCLTFKAQSLGIEGVAELAGGTDFLG
jgi:hypothetical protein